MQHFALSKTQLRATEANRAANNLDQPSYIFLKSEPLGNKLFNETANQY